MLEVIRILCRCESCFERITGFSIRQVGDETNGFKFRVYQRQSEGKQTQYGVIDKQGTKESVCVVTRTRGIAEGGP